MRLGDIERGAAEATLRAHGYPDPERGLEVLHVALEEALAEAGEDDADVPHPLH